MGSADDSNSAFGGNVTLNSSLTISSQSVSPGNALTFAGNILHGSGTNSVTLTGPGNVVFLGNATYQGATTVNGGYLTVGATGSLPSTTTLNINNASTVELDNLAQTLAGLNGSAQSTLNLFNGNGTTLTVGSGSFAGSINDGMNAANLVKNTTGTLYLNGASTYYGSTTVTAGALLYGASGSVSPYTTITVNTAGAVGLESSGLAGLLPYLASASNGTLVVTPATAGDAVNFQTAVLPALSLGALDSETYTGILTPNNVTYRLGGGGGTLTIASALTDANGPGTGLVVNAPATGGTVILTSGNNTYTGTTLITSGTLQVGDGVTNNGSLPNGILTNNSTLIFADPTAASYGGSLAGNGLVVKTAAGELTIVGSSSNTGPTLISAGTLGIGPGGSLLGNSAITDNSTLAFSGNGPLLQGTNFATAAITGSGGVVVTSGSTTFTANNTYTGGTTVNGGTLALNAGGGAGAIVAALTINPGGLVQAVAGNALGYNAGTSITQVNINEGILDAGPNGDEGYLANYTLTGGSMTNASGGGDFPMQGGYSVTTIGTNVSSVISAAVQLRSGTVTFNVAQGTVPNGVDLLVSGVISGGYSLNKTGAGEMLLTGANTYTGGTTVSQGTLALQGAAFSTTGATIRSLRGPY